MIVMMVLGAAPRSATAAEKAPGPPQEVVAASTLDLDALKARLRQTKAIGLLTKLSIKNQVNDLLNEFRKHYAGRSTTMVQLRRSYDLLVTKVLLLLHERDQQLASDILSSRERIWALLADRKTFATLPAV
jgi:hypothetical protein